MYTPHVVLKFSFCSKTAHLTILAMFRDPKPMVQIFSRDHIMFFPGLRPITFGFKFISNYVKVKKRDDTHTIQQRCDWKCARGAEPPECEYFACRCPFFQGTLLRRIVLQGAGGSPKFFFFCKWVPQVAK